MLRPGSVACPAPARTFTTELAWAGSPQVPTSVMTGWLIVIYHRRTFTGWTGSLMGCEQMNTDGHRFLTRLKPRSLGENEHELMDPSSHITGIELHCPYLCSSVSICGFAF